MTLSADASQLANLLAVLTQPDTQAIRQAEQALKPLLKDPRSVPALVEILKSKESQVSVYGHSLHDPPVSIDLDKPAKPYIESSLNA